MLNAWRYTDCQESFFMISLFNFSFICCLIAIVRTVFWFDFNWAISNMILAGGLSYVQGNMHHTYTISTWCWCWNLLSFSSDRCRLFCLINVLICQAGETDGTTAWHHGNPEFCQWTAEKNMSNNNNSGNPTQQISPLLHQLYIHFSGTQKTRYKKKKKKNEKRRWKRRWISSGVIRCVYALLTDFLVSLTHNTMYHGSIFN